MQDNDDDPNNNNDDNKNLTLNVLSFLLPTGHEGSLFLKTVVMDTWYCHT